MGTTDSRGIYTPAIDEDGYDDEMAANFALFDTITDRNTAITSALAGINKFTKTVAFYDPTTLAAVTVVACRFPFACTATALRGFRTGGTGATVQAYRFTSGSLPGSIVATSSLSLTSATTWLSTTTLSNTAFAIGDSLVLAILTVAGTPTQISAQVDFTRP